MEKITHQQYGEAVAALLKLALSSGGSSTSAAAQLLLSAYNGNNWHVDITSLCSFDPNHYKAALDVIRGRVELYTEPQSVIQDGDSLFHRLWDKYYWLHVGNRNLSTCRHCDGDGKQWDSEGDRVIGVCSCCGGAGRLNEPRFEHSRNIGNKFEESE